MTLGLMAWRDEDVAADLESGDYLSMQSWLSMHQTPRGVVDGSKFVRKTVPCLSLRALLSRHGLRLDTVDWLVLDAEGTDWEILKQEVLLPSIRSMDSGEQLEPLPRLILFEITGGRKMFSYRGEDEEGGGGGGGGGGGEEGEGEEGEGEGDEDEHVRLLRMAGYACAAVSEDDVFCVHGGETPSLPSMDWGELEERLLELRERTKNVGCYGEGSESCALLGSV